MNDCMLPRQKMINLMYIVLMAMLALNVSSGVLDGFTLMDKTLQKSKENTIRENNIIYANLREMATANPIKAAQWYDLSLKLKSQSDSLCNLCEDLKTSILTQADGENYAPDRIIHKDNTEIPARIMLSEGKGCLLKERMNNYRLDILPMIGEKHKRSIINEYLSTAVRNDSGKSWEEQIFESMPVAAAVAMLTKLQTDIRYAEGEVLHELCSSVDKKDIRVNDIQPFVIPESRIVFSGNNLNAKIMMGAVDTTNVPDVYVGKNKVNDGRVSIKCFVPGTYDLAGYISTTDNEGNIVKKRFSFPYTVIDPAATVSADLMNVLYAGYNNPLSVSVPGVPRNSLIVSSQGAMLVNKGDGKFIINPKTPGSKVSISVSAHIGGKIQPMGTSVFNVRKLPDPAPYISLNDSKGGANRFKGGAIQRSLILNTARIAAASDDGILDVQFRVKSFDILIMDAIGNALPISSDGNQWSEKQKEAIGKMRRNARFFITNIRAVGPDAIERKLNTSMEVLIK